MLWPHNEPQRAIGQGCVFLATLRALERKLSSDSSNPHRRNPMSPHPTNKVLLNTLSGPLELRKASLFEQQGESLYDSKEIVVDSALREAITWQRFAIVGLLWELGYYESLTVREDVIFNVLKQNLKIGWLLVERPGAKEGESAEDAAWSAVDSFRSAVGRTFPHAGGRYRLVFRADADAVRRDGDYDGVRAGEAKDIVAKVARAVRLQLALETLIDCIVDLSSPPSQHGFVLLREPMSQATRPVSAEPAMTPAQLKNAAPKTHRLVLEVEFASGEPLGNAAYQLEGPGGPRDGRLGAKGSCTWQDVRRGAFTLTLPDLLKKA